ncbi:MAG: SDR family oxidoreductase, partial [Phaeodactylibacter sp.]|nr:SDR family oxidoreductase [Phaeodactylibacter sp.]
MNHQIAVITGGAQGIGKVTAQILRQNGWQPILLDRDEEAGREAVEAAPDLIFIPCDVAEEQSVRGAIAAVLAQFGRIDGLVNNAGFGINKSIEELTLEEWNRVIGVNLTGA